MEPKSPAQSRTVLAHWMGPADANANGDIHGGTIMKLVDEAAGLSSVRHAGQRTVTASIDRMSFLVPVKVGELVTVTATLNAAWRTSMEISVRVEAENPLTGAVRHASDAYLTMVAIDEHGDPMSVPPLLAESAEDEWRMRQAELRRAHRLAERSATEQDRVPSNTRGASESPSD